MSVARARCDGCLQVLAPLALSPLVRARSLSLSLSLSLCSSLSCNGSWQTRGEDADMLTCAKCGVARYCSGDICTLLLRASKRALQKNLLRAKAYRRSLSPAPFSPPRPFPAFPSLSLCLFFFSSFSLSPFLSPHSHRLFFWLDLRIVASWRLSMRVSEDS